MVQFLPGKRQNTAWYVCHRLYTLLQAYKAVSSIRLFPLLIRAIIKILWLSKKHIIEEHDCIPLGKTFVKSQAFIHFVIFLIVKSRMV